MATTGPAREDCWTIRAPGTYLLLLRLDEAVQLEVGRLGRVAFPAGFYVYIGSALGGLGARLRRHARREKRPHWHVDALRAAGTLVAVAVRLGPDRVECETAATVAGLAGAARPVPRFGASDCRCRAHLVLVVDEPDLGLDPTWRVYAIGDDRHGDGVGPPGGASGASSVGTGT